MDGSTKVIHTPQGWFVESPGGRIGPMDSQQQANDYLALMSAANAARDEIACTDAECFV